MFSSLDGIQFDWLRCYTIEERSLSSTFRIKLNLGMEWIFILHLISFLGLV